MSEAFTITDQAMERAYLAARELVLICQAIARVQLEGRELGGPPIPEEEGTLVGRTAVSFAVQSIWRVREKVAISPLDFIDGVANSMGSVLGQQAPAASDAVLDSLDGTIRTYTNRARRAHMGVDHG